MSRCADGFSLLEVLVALAIVSIAVTSALGLTMQLSRGSTSQAAHVTAQALASSVLQRAVAERPDAGIGAMTFQPPFDQYRYQMHTARIGSSLRRYVVHVEWQGGSVQLQQMVFDTTGVSL